MLKIIDNIIARFENTKYPPFYYVTLFFGTVLIRDFLETILGEGRILSYKQLLVHYPISFLYLFIMLAIILTIFSKKKMSLVLKCLTPAYTIIILPPIIDFFVFGIGNFRPKYLFLTQGNISDLIQTFLSYFSSASPLNKGMTLGMRIEVGLAIIITIIYVWRSTLNIFRAISSGIILYIITIFFAASPVFKTLLHKQLLSLGLIPSSAFISYDDFIFFAIIICLIIAVFVWNHKKALAVLSNIRVLRIIHFFFMIFLGIWFGTKGNIELIKYMKVFDLIWLFTSFFFAWLFSVFTNDIIDKTIDTLTNRSRPLVSQKLTITEMRAFAIIFFILGAFASSLIESRFLFFFLAFCSLYWIYSMPPLRIKRIPVIATAIIATASLVPLFAGNRICGQLASDPPIKTIIGIWIMFTLAFNAKDLKDTLGDKKNGIYTITTIFGHKHGKIIIGTLTAISYLLVPLFFNLNYLSVWLISALFGTITCLCAIFLNERWIFIAYFSFIIIITIFFHNYIQNSLFL